ncbi:unnamed protein product [Blepharisma stoltei]|uniref:Uncharacterized protein n=1 Tax=Blepharisma stoltei TaxID=1481888 RepID=A0AAU9K3F7_9CILI|nr:unnamed protein product [Blepharisma stoltei]
MRSKSFDFFQYMKPMISSIGHIQEKKNEFLKRSLMARSTRQNSKITNYSDKILVEISAQRTLEKSLQSTSKEKITARRGTSALQTKERAELSMRRDSSSMNGRCTPNHDFILPKTAFGKPKFPWEFDSTRKTRANSFDISVESTYIFDNEKKKIKGIPFEKQSSRKSLINFSPKENLQINRQQSNCLRPCNRINKIQHNMMKNKVFGHGENRIQNPLCLSEHKSKSVIMI